MEWIKKKIEQQSSESWWYNLTFQSDYEANITWKGKSCSVLSCWLVSSLYGFGGILHCRCSSKCLWQLRLNVSGNIMQLMYKSCRLHFFSIGHVTAREMLHPAFPLLQHWNFAFALHKFIPESTPTSYWICLHSSVLHLIAYAIMFLGYPELSMEKV